MNRLGEFIYSTLIAKMQHLLSLVLQSVVVVYFHLMARKDEAKSCQ